MYNLLQVFEKEKISLAYFGVFSDNITSMLIDLSETYLSKTDNLKKLSRKTSFLIAESFQNIIRHSVVEKENIANINYNKDFYQISIVEDRIIIASANIIENDEIPALNEHIEHINSLDSEELKLLHQHILKTGQISQKGGAGLGLIEIVRKSGLPLQKKYIKLNHNYTLLLLGLEISYTEKTEKQKIDLNVVEKYYKTLVKDDVLLLYKGDFSSSSNSTIIEILNSNFNKGDKINSEKLKNIIIIIEIMQNVSKHGIITHGIKEGFFTIKKRNNELFIECSNFVSIDSVENLRQQINKIKACSKDELDQIYKKTLAESYLTEDENAGLGLLEIARLTNNSFSFDMIETPEKDFLYTIKVKTF